VPRLKTKVNDDLSKSSLTSKDSIVGFIRKFYNHKKYYLFIFPRT